MATTTEENLLHLRQLADQLRHHADTIDAAADALGAPRRPTSTQVLGCDLAPGDQRVRPDGDILWTALHVHHGHLNVRVTCTDGTNRHLGKDYAVRVRLVDCPACDGHGCPACDHTGRMRGSQARAWHTDAATRPCISEPGDLDHLNGAAHKEVAAR